MQALLEAIDRFLERASDAKRLATASKRYQRAVRKRFKAQGRFFIDHVLTRGHGTVFREADPLSLAAKLEAVAKMLQHLNDFEEDDATAGELEAALRVAIELGATEVIAQIDPTLGITFNLDNPRAIAYLQDHGLEQLSNLIDRTTADQLKTILLEGLDQHLGYDAIASQIRKKFAEFTRSRAEMIAVTEMGNAFSDGTLGAALEVDSHGIEMEKSWLTAGDGRVDDRCVSNENAGWIEVDETFPSGDDRPLAHPNCRCALLTRVAKEESVPV